MSKKGINRKDREDRRARLAACKKGDEEMFEIWGCSIVSCGVASLLGSRRPSGSLKKYCKTKTETVRNDGLEPECFLFCNIFSERSALGAAAAAYPHIPFIPTSPFLHLRALRVSYKCAFATFAVFAVKK